MCYNKFNYFFIILIVKLLKELYLIGFNNIFKVK